MGLTKQGPRRTLLICWRGCVNDAGAGLQRVEFGKHKGLTFREVYEKYPVYCKWLLEQPEQTNSMALQKFLKAGPNVEIVVDTPKKNGAAARIVTEDVGTVFQKGSAVGGTVRFGQHKGKTFAEVFEAHGEYCQWVLQSAQKPDSPSNVKDFAAWLAAQKSGALESSGSKPTKRQWSQKQSKAASSDPMPLRTASSSRTTATRSRDGNQDSKKPRPEDTVKSGNWLLGGGKYAEKTYLWTFDNDPMYCDWVVNWGLSEVTHRNIWAWPFIVYVQRRWLMGGNVPQHISLTAKSCCLEGASFVITGTPNEMQRHVLEELITFFGGKVLSAVSGNTSYLVVGHVGYRGQAVELSAKYSKANQLGIEMVTVRKLLDDLEKTAGGADEVTFTSRADQPESSSRV